MDQQSRLNSGSSPYFSNRYYYHQDQDRSSEGERALPRKSRRGTRQSDTNSDYSSFGMNNTDDQLFSALRPRDAVDASEDAAYNSTNTSLSNIGEKNLSEMSDQYRISSPSHISSRKKSKMSHSSESAPVSMGSRYHSSEHKFRKYVLRRPNKSHEESDANDVLLLIHPSDASMQSNESSRQRKSYYSSKRVLTSPIPPSFPPKIQKTNSTESSGSVTYTISYSKSGSRALQRQSHSRSKQEEDSVYLGPSPSPPPLPQSEVCLSPPSVHPHCSILQSPVPPSFSSRGFAKSTSTPNTTASTLPTNTPTSSSNVINYSKLFSASSRPPSVSRVLPLTSFLPSSSNSVLTPINMSTNTNEICKSQSTVLLSEVMSASPKSNSILPSQVGSTTTPSLSHSQCPYLTNSSNEERPTVLSVLSESLQNSSLLYPMESSFHSFS